MTRTLVTTICALAVFGCGSEAETSITQETSGTATTFIETSTATSTTATTPAPERIEINDALVLTDGRPANLLVISVDTLRRDHVNAFGYSRRETTPTMDIILNEGVSLRNHRSCSSWTLPSFLCFLTGQDQISLGHWPPNNDGLPPETPDEIELMAERFQELGFHTMLYGASGFLGSSTNTNQGYDEGMAYFEPVGAEVMNTALSMLEDRPTNKPFMMHIHFIDPHMPYNPTEQYLTELKKIGETSYDLTTDKGTLELWNQYPVLGTKAQNVNMQHLEIRYDGEIKTVDDQIARLLSSDTLGDIWDSTLVVLVADHGEEFFEHENFNHGYNAFEEITRGVAGLYWPEHLEPAVVDAPTLHQDLLPTVFEIFGFEPDKSFTGLVVGGIHREYSFNLTYRLEKTHQSVTDGHTKLMYRWDDSDLLDGPKYFYDLDVDPKEQENIYDPKDPRVIEMWEELLPEVERLAAQEKTVQPHQPGP